MLRTAAVLLAPLLFACSLPPEPPPDIPGSVTGRVLDAEGRPVAGARVTTPDGRGDWRKHIDLDLPNVVVTNASGRFLLPVLTPSDRKILHARRDGLGAATSERFRVEGGEVTSGIELRLRPAWTVVFVLIPPAGGDLPEVAGVDVVRATGEDDVRAVKGAAKIHHELSGDEIRVWGLGRAPVTLHVWADGWVGQRFRTPDVLPPEGERERRVEVRLTRGLSIRGRVERGDGKLRVLALRGAAGYLHRPPGAWTDPDDGRFELRGLVPGEHRIVVRRYESGGRELKVLQGVPAGTDDLVIRLSDE